MKAIIVIESVEELLRCANRTRAQGSESPILPPDAFIEIDNDLSDLRLKNASGFLLENVTALDLIEALFKNADLKMSVRRLA